MRNKEFRFTNLFTKEEGYKERLQDQQQPRIQSDALIVEIDCSLDCQNLPVVENVN